MKIKQLVSLLLTLCIVVGLLPRTALAASSTAAGGMNNFRRDGSYQIGTFNDVSADAWYAEGVSAAYELGLMKGSGAGAFSPQGNVTVAEAVAMASRLHRRYSSGKDDFTQKSPWYQVYVDYALANGILSGDEFPGGYGENITRAQMAHLFAAALPEKELTAINAVNSLPDVNSSTPYNQDIFLLYRAGVLTGNDEQGTFTPDTPISRSQVAAIIARMALPSLRKTTGVIQPLNYTRQPANSQAAASSRYLYAVMDTAAMTQEDLKAVGEYLAAITDATVLVADASGFANAKSLYTALKADAAQRGGTVVGVQIFGTPVMVPAFQVEYKALMGDGSVDDGKTFLSDLFYGNFDNDPARISEHYNIKDHFDQKWNVTLVPQWPVVRLPLSKGEFTAFFDKYKAFVADTGLEQQRLVNFSNPIFPSKTHTDEMGRFLARADKEFHVLDAPYRLYGNLDGQYPVNSNVLGGYSRENLSKENDAGIMELLVNSHGQWNEIAQCIFENDKEKQTSFLNTDNINTVLDGSAYYLDCWACLNGYAMANNLTTTALNGKCVGVFSATNKLSNNGANCDASLSDMAKSNFYYFYYQYLKALHEGQSRSAAFYAAQRAYGEALIKDSANSVRGEGNYQFNLYNLLGYHNFGVIEPSAAWPTFEAAGYISQAAQSVPKEPYQPGTDSANGTPSSKASPVETTCVNRLSDGSVTVHSCTVQPLANGHVQYILDYTAPKGLVISIYNRPSGDLFNIVETAGTSGARSTLTFDVPAEHAAAAEICIKFVLGNSVSDFCVVLLPAYQK